MDWWGREIEVNGVRPTWLRDDDCRVSWKHGHAVTPAVEAALEFDR